jgi:hypothetical protein
VLLTACTRPCAPDPHEPPPDLPATAKVDVWRSMNDDRLAPRHPSDGGGRVTVLEGPTRPPIAGGRASWRFQLEVGPQGIAVGGAVMFHAPPFWGWSPPQTVDPTAPGFTEHHTDAEGVTLEEQPGEDGVLRLLVRGRALRGGEHVEVHYGAGPEGAQVDRYTEAAEPFWFGVDGDGDGIRALVADPPTTPIVAGPADRLIVTLPTTARPGEQVRVTVAAVDSWGNAGVPGDGAFELASTIDLSLPSELPIGPHGQAELLLTAPERGMFQIGARWGEATGLSEPMLVHPDAPHVLWADLQVHTSLSDGSGALEEVYRYARDVAGLDAIAVTDHDHWGMRFLDTTPALWEEEVQAANRWYEPGRFVTFPAFEWTSWLYGHRHVLYVGAPGPVLSSLEPDTRTPDGLWAALRPWDALTLAHHSAGGPIAVDWRFKPDPRVEPVTEVCSVHGSSEAADTPLRIYSFVPGNTVRDALLAGHRFGLICSTDGHDGHPGQAQLQASSGGLAGIFTEDRTREGIAAALRARHVFGTSGPRLLLRLRVDGQEMGAELPATGAPPDIEVRVIAGDVIERIDLIYNGEVYEQRLPGGHAVKESFTLPPLQPGDFVYARVRLMSGQAAWSSPVWITDGEAARSGEE